MRWRQTYRRRLRAVLAGDLLSCACAVASPVWPPRPVGGATTPGMGVPSGVKLRALNGKSTTLCGPMTMPYPPVGRQTFRTGFSLDALPGWGKAMSLPIPEKLALLRDPVERLRLEELSRTGDSRLNQWADRVILETFTPETKRYQGRIVADIAAEEGR